MIEARNLHKYYGQLHVLKGVNMSIEKGEIVAIVGKSGAGKSTLLHIAGTLDKADKGTMSIGGTAIHNLSANELAAFRNKNLGFIFQFHHLLPEFNAVENVCMPAFIAGISANVAKARAQELLAYLGLEHRFTHKPTELSGGEQQRVSVARALMNKPEVVFADEPSGNLDTDSSRDLHQLLFQLRNDFQQTFVIVTHNTELAQLADRTLIMKDGNIIT